MTLLTTELEVTITLHLTGELIEPEAPGQFPNVDELDIERITLNRMTILPDESSVDSRRARMALDRVRDALISALGEDTIADALLATRA